VLKTISQSKNPIQKAIVIRKKIADIDNIRPNFSVNRDLKASKIGNIKHDIQDNGEIKPLFVDDNGLIDGHHRYAALLELGKKKVPVYELKGNLGKLPKSVQDKIADKYNINSESLAVANSRDVNKSLENFHQKAEIKLRDGNYRYINGFIELGQAQEEAKYFQDKTVIIEGIDDDSRVVFGLYKKDEPLEKSKQSRHDRMSKLGKPFQAGSGLKKEGPNYYQGKATVDVDGKDEVLNAQVSKQSFPGKSWYFLIDKVADKADELYSTKIEAFQALEEAVKLGFYYYPKLGYVLNDSKGVKKEQPLEKISTLFHVTPRKNLERIMVNGIQPQKKSLTHGAFGQDIRTDKNKVYLFSSFDDAARWAHRVEWDTKEPVVILRVKDNKNNYTEDKHFEAGMGKGKWLMSDAIDPSKIDFRDVIHFDSKTFGPLLVQTNDPNKHLLPDGTIIEKSKQSKHMRVRSGKPYFAGEGSKKSGKFKEGDSVIYKFRENEPGEKVIVVDGPEKISDIFHQKNAIGYKIKLQNKKSIWVDEDKLSKGKPFQAGKRGVFDAPILSKIPYKDSTIYTKQTGKDAFWVHVRKTAGKGYASLGGGFKTEDAAIETAKKFIDSFKKLEVKNKRIELENKIIQRVGNISHEELEQYDDKQLSKIAENYEIGTKINWDLKSTGFDFYDALLGDKPYKGGGDYKNLREYYAAQKGIKGEIVKMSPDEYMQRVAEIQKIPLKETLDMIEPKLSDEYFDKMSQGAKFNIPFLDYSTEKASQEGRHRVMAAKKLGAKEIPVLIVEKVSQEDFEKSLYDRLKQGTPTEEDKNKMSQVGHAIDRQKRAKQKQHQRISKLGVPFRAGEGEREVNLKKHLKLLLIKNLRRYRDAKEVVGEHVSKIIKKLKSTNEVKPILVDKENGMVDGRHRLAALKELGFKKIPAYYFDQDLYFDKESYIIHAYNDSKERISLDKL